MPGSSGADAHGCVAAAEPVECMPGQTCDEDALRCRTECATTADADGDGVASMDCGGTDCDDGDALRSPSFDEVCDTSDRDEDCDPATFGSTDADVDGAVSNACCNGTGAARRCGTDCDDARGGAHPGVPEVCNALDDDCDGATDESATSLVFPDADGDMFGRAGSAGAPGCLGPGLADNDDDCDDAAASVNPAASESCNGLDDNCNGMLDHPEEDNDTDGHADDACAGIAGSDCDDGDAATFDGAAEVCDGLDQDCDGEDEDGDDDGHGAIGADCTGGSLPVDDCDDTRASISPSATEVCDAVDDDCDPTTLGFLDGDGDGQSSSACCNPSAGAPVCGGDCDDGDPGRSPMVVEVCNGRDDDCDPFVDETLVGCIPGERPREIQQGFFSAGDPVHLVHVVVTAMRDRGTSWLLYVQDDERTGDWNGIQIFVSPIAGRDRPSIGSTVILDGRVNETFGETQIWMLTSLAVTGTATVPAPMGVTSTTLRREESEGLLVRLSGVTAGAAMGTGSDFVTSDGVYVDDALFAFTRPASGTTFTSIVGVVGEDNRIPGGYVLRPRSAADFVP